MFVGRKRRSRASLLGWANESIVGGDWRAKHVPFPIVQRHLHERRSAERSRSVRLSYLCRLDVAGLLAGPRVRPARTGVDRDRDRGLRDYPTTVSKLAGRRSTVVPYPIQYVQAVVSWSPPRGGTLSAKVEKAEEQSANGTGTLVDPICRTNGYF